MSAEAEPKPLPFVVIFPDTNIFLPRWPSEPSGLADLLSRAAIFKIPVYLLEAVELKESHTRFYLNLVRFFQGRMSEADALPPEPPAGNTDQEVELPFDTVAYGIGNWHLYNGDAAKAQEYFHRILKGHVWITWGFVGAETELLSKPAGAK